MTHQYSIIYKDILLKPMTMEESEKYRRLRNQNNIRCWFETMDIISKEAQQRWFASYLEKDDELMFSILNPQDYFVGGCSLYKIFAGGYCAEFGRLIVAPDYHGLGYGRMATIAAIEIARAIGLQSLNLEVYEDNISALSAYRSAGFIETGRKKTFQNRLMILMEVKI